MSFMRFFEEKKKRPSVSVFIDHCREAIERDVYDALLDPAQRDRLVVDHLFVATGLQEDFTRVNYPYSEEIVAALAARDPSKLRKSHTKFQEWATGRSGMAKIDASLFECKAYLYGSKSAEFSKELADRLAGWCIQESEANTKQIASMIESAIEGITNWHGSSVTVTARRAGELVANEAEVIVGISPVELSFRCKKKSNILEVSDVQDIDGQALKLQEDYSNLIGSIRGNSRRFSSWYFLADTKNRPYFGKIKRDISLGIESAIPSGLNLYSSPPENTGQDVWKVKTIGPGIVIESNGCHTAEETTVKWLDLFRKA